MTGENKPNTEADKVKSMQQTGAEDKTVQSKKELEEKVDEASEESFPASDPPAFTVTKGAG